MSPLTATVRLKRVRSCCLIASLHVAAGDGHAPLLSCVLALSDRRFCSQPFSLPALYCSSCLHVDSDSDDSDSDADTLLPSNSRFGRSTRKVRSRPGFNDEGENGLKQSGRNLLSSMIEQSTTNKTRNEGWRGTAFGRNAFGSGMTKEEEGEAAGSIRSSASSDVLTEHLSLRELEWVQKGSRAQRTDDSTAANTKPPENPDRPHGHVEGEDVSGRENGREDQVSTIYLGEGGFEMIEELTLSRAENDELRVENEALKTQMEQLKTDQLEAWQTQVIMLA